MTFPTFSAEASEYEATAYYRGHASVGNIPPLAGLVVPAYRPQRTTQFQCSECNDACQSQYEACNGLVTGATGLVVMACAVFPISCALVPSVAFFGGWACTIFFGACRAYCLAARCCPKACALPDPTRPGFGCCDSGESCVDENDPNSRSGCCPSDRHVCGGKCCNAEQSCVGSSCCPPGATTVCNGVCCAGSCAPNGLCCPSPNRVCGNDCCPPLSKCCEGHCCATGQECHPITGTCWSPPPPIPTVVCPTGSESCNGKCCPPGKMCCNSWWDPPGVADCHDPLTCQPR
jgi:hypothetical protein